MRKRFAALAVLLAIGAALAPRAGAQPAPGERLRRELERPGSIRKPWDPDHWELDLPAGAFLMTGNVALEIGERDVLTLFADAVVLWGPKGGAQLEDAHELYAEGNVYLAYGGETFEADALYLDLRTGEGRFANVTVRSEGGAQGLGGLGLGAAPQDPGGGALGLGAFERTPFLARAALARVSEDFTLFEGEDVVVSTCTFGVPHFAIGADSARVALRPGERDQPDGDTDAGARAELSRPRLEILGRRVLPFPSDLTWDTDWNRYLPRVRLGHTSRFGYYDLNQVPVYEGRGLDLQAKIDYMSDRGVGTGANAAWRGPAGDKRTYFGFFDGYYVHDGRKDDVTAQESGETDGHPEDRGRLRLFHRDELPFGFRREVEASWISDRGFLHEFYEREARTGKEQETVGYVRWLDGDMGATLFGRWRVNDFQTQAEYFPRARWSWIGEPFLASVLPDGRGVYLTTAYELSNARKRFDDLLLDQGTPGLADSPRVYRADFSNRLDYPVPIGPLELDPFFEARNTAFSRQFADGDDTYRNTLGFGAIATTDAWRDFDVSSNWLGVTGFRHVFTPSAGYVRTFYNDVDPEALVRIDEMEEQRKQEFVPISLRNRIQGGRGDASLDLLDLLVDTRYFPRSRWAAPRNGFFLEQIIAEAQGLTAPRPLKSWDTIRADLRLNPADFLSLRAKAEWDPSGLGLVREDATVLVRPDPAFAVLAGYRLLKNVYSAVELGGDLRATEKWGFFASAQYDFEQKKFIRQRLSIRRFYHRFVLEGTIDADLAQHDVRFSVTFSPLELFRREGPFGGEISSSVEPVF